MTRRFESKTALLFTWMAYEYCCVLAICSAGKRVVKEMVPFGDGWETVRIPQSSYKLRIVLAG